MSLVSAAAGFAGGSGNGSSSSSRISLPNFSMPMSKRKLIRIESESSAWPGTTMLDGGPSLTALWNHLRRNTGHIDQVDDNSRRGEVQKPNLTTLPTEILWKICADLPSLWLINLSNTSRALHRALNGKRANRIWYDSLPIALFAKPEKYQLEAELHNWANDDWVEPFVSHREMPDNLFARYNARPLDEALEVFPRMATAFNAEQTLGDTIDYELTQDIDRSNDNSLLSRRNAVAALKLDAVRARTDSLTPNSMATDSGPLPLLNVPQPSVTHTTGLETSSFSWYLSPGTPLPAAYTSFGLRSPYPPANLSTRTGRTLDDDIMSQDDIGLHPNKRRRIEASPGLIGPFHFPGTQYAPRDRVKILGGPYVPNFNYKREILGRMAQKVKRRCFLCLNMDYFLIKQGIATKHWGIQWCRKCLDENTIKLTSLEIVLDDLKVAFPAIRMVKYPYAEHDRICFSYRTIRLYKPEVDVWFASLGLFSTDFAITTSGRMKLQLSLAPDGRFREHLITYRKDLRWRLIQFAELIWDGVDPAPIEVLGPDGAVMHQSRDRITRDRFAVFRERFAPTANLRHFLFPPHLLPDSISRANPWAFEKAMCLGHGYPHDPYEKSNTRQPPPANIVVSNTAEQILDQLTAYTDPRYCFPNWGGINSNWIRAAEEYHVTRLVLGLITGVTISAFPWTMNKHMHGDTRHASWREKLGFGQMAPEVDQDNLHKAVKRLELADLVGSEITEELILEEKRLMEAERDRKQKIIAFANIATTCCKRCPVTDQPLPTKGLRGIIVHMRRSHPAMFYGGDQWTIAG